MNKRTFLKLSSALMAAPLLPPFIRKMQNQQPITNWAGNLTYGTTNIEYPTSVDALQQLVKKYNKVKVLGTRHCFNTIADSKDRFISLRDMNKIIALDQQAQTVTVEGGIKYGELAPYLHENGFALHNLASLPHISIAGAVATATHGSGIKNGNLSTAVLGIEFINAAGELVNLTKKNDGDKFNGAVVALGAFGVVTKLTLELQPTFNMKQVVYRNLAMSELEKNFNEIMGSGYSVSLFTDWKNKNINEVWVKSKVENENDAARPELFGAKLAQQNLHPIETESAENCTDQMGVPGPWYERMPHFKMGFKPSAGKELQAEYFVPIEHAYEAMMIFEKLTEKITPHLFISEIRAIAADDFWMSPCHKKTCVALHTTWKQEVEAVMQLLPVLEEQLAPFEARPHWAKLFTMSPSVLRSRYEKLNDFKQLVSQYDPNGKFRNEFLATNIFGS